MTATPRRFDSYRSASNPQRASLTLAALGLALAVTLPSDARAATVVVNSLLDTTTAGDAKCTLREAIKNVNAVATDTTAGDCAKGDNNSGVDAIVFSVAGTITVTTPLPDITTKVSINGKGTTASPNPACPAWPHAPSVALSASGTVATGLVLKGGGSTIRSLAVQRFTRGVRFQTLGGNRVQCSYLGTDLAGAVAAGNGLGVAVSSADNIVGTDSDGVADANEGNLVSGNSSLGVSLDGAGATGNRVAGNRIGTNAAGTVALANGLDGVGVTFGASRNVIGTDGNNQLDTLEGNLISGNPRFGVDLYGAGSNHNRVAGNRVGTNLAGSAAIANGDGVRIEEGAQSNVVGTNGDGVADSLEGNTISGNTRDGVILLSSGTSLNVVAGNLIGVTANGLSPLGNGGDGVEVYDGPSNNVIGSNLDGLSDTLEGNRIAHNRGNGVVIFEVYVKTTLGNSIRRNAIDNNGALGIDLQPYWAGPSTNDPKDGDTGPNGLQNYPVLASATLSGTTTTVTGKLNSTVGTKFYIDYYVSPTCDASGYGEGARWLRSQVTSLTNTAGDVTLTATFTGLAVGQVITATASTTASGGSTSELSKCVKVQ